VTFCPYCNQFTAPAHCREPRCGGYVCGSCGQCNRQERFHPEDSRSPATAPASRTSRAERV
jgi:hypothetical protein